MRRKVLTGLAVELVGRKKTPSTCFHHFSTSKKKAIFHLVSKKQYIKQYKMLANLLARNRPRVTSLFTASSSLFSTPCTKRFITTTSSSSSSSSSSATAEIPPRKMTQKHKVPQRRASKLLNILKQEEFQGLRGERQWPEITAGDSVVVEKLPNMSTSEPNVVKGVVIAKVNRASDSAITILNVEHGTPVVRRIIMYSPLIKSIKVLQKAFIHKGKKRVRRSKLYYLMDRDPENFTVK